ncbi:pyridoxine 5'-phosphate synthase [bacterium Unc6]|nr:pyridoxine 5'-phosphate synthase [bacterium Unc6]
MPKLGVNIDHIATIRQARKTFEPDPVFACMLAVLGGADVITVHLREDRRHIQDRDVRIIREIVPVKFNLEMSLSKDIMEIACEIKPEQATLVPEKRQEITTEGGLNVVTEFSSLEESIKILKNKGIAVSLFIDPDPIQIEYAKKSGADFIEIHTGKYANAKGEEAKKEAITIEKAVNQGLETGLCVNAGHGLTYYNVKRIAFIKGIQELHIGHSIISRAVFVGIENAVREMKEAICY